MELAKIKDSLVFFGSGPVAKSSLEFIAKHFQIEAIITKPATKEEMERAAPNVAVFTAATAADLVALVQTQLFKSRLGVLVDFGIIVPKGVIDYFPLGIVNSHFSLLPEWRGADPITFSVLSDQQRTGVSLMLLDEKMDTGKLITQKSLHVPEGVTTPKLTQMLIELSNELLVKYLPGFIDGKIKPKTQPHPDRATYSRRLLKSDGVIDWSKSARQLEREVRAFLGWPGSRTTIAGKEVIITKAHVVDTTANRAAGQAFIRDKRLVVACGEKALAIDKLKPAGRNEMTGEAFIAGHKNQLS